MDRMQQAVPVHQRRLCDLQIGFEDGVSIRQRFDSVCVCVGCPECGIRVSNGSLQPPQMSVCAESRNCVERSSRLLQSVQAPSRSKRSGIDSNSRVLRTRLNSYPHEVCSEHIWMCSEHIQQQPIWTLHFDGVRVGDGVWPTRGVERNRRSFRVR